MAAYQGIHHEASQCLSVPFSVYCFQDLFSKVRSPPSQCYLYTRQLFLSGILATSGYNPSWPILKLKLLVSQKMALS